ncbi:unnamed protein product [Paramecium octaurelia]|uniref:Uncharacterized protein n=1 Tax=Paramecium octaurelia TaxID=43137 RepID=A0A8S1X811_PAROT|nr:unnamed protein product [Paramecium octaurelia]
MPKHIYFSKLEVVVASKLQANYLSCHHILQQTQKSSFEKLIYGHVKGYIFMDDQLIWSINIYYKEHDREKREQDKNWKEILGYYNRVISADDFGGSKKCHFVFAIFIRLVLEQLLVIFKLNIITQQQLNAIQWKLTLRNNEVVQIKIDQKLVWEEIKANYIKPISLLINQKFWKLIRQFFKTEETSQMHKDFCLWYYQDSNSKIFLIGKNLEFNLNYKLLKRSIYFLVQNKGNSSLGEFGVVQKEHFIGKSQKIEFDGLFLVQGRRCFRLVDRLKETKLQLYNTIQDIIIIFL